MITEFVVADEAPWQRELANAITDPAELRRVLDLPPPDDADSAARRLFPLRVPRPFVARMRCGDAQDPLLRQVLTDRAEFDRVPGYVTDPLAEHDTARPGLLHKYGNRVLLIVRGGCAVNCRYCFRRHFPYGDETPNREQMAETFAYLRQSPEIMEVILSGGDPLMAKDDYLAWLMTELAAIPHIRRVRIHTRLPVVIPQRITPGLLDALTATRLPVIMVLHSNHAHELDDRLRQACHEIRQRGLWLLNQAVLLRGVNDSEAALIALSEALFDAGVQPYYLHLLDPVAGAAHFDVPESEARILVSRLHATLPGFLVPRLVREVPGEAGKTPIDLYLHDATPPIGPAGESHEL